MYQRGIRGAITVENNSVDEVRFSVIELITAILKQNNFKPQDISHVIFTLTEDITCVYPAKIVREEFPSWRFAPMMCVREMYIENSLKKCLRVLVVINTNLAQEKINHVYLKGAKYLREDLNKI